MDIFFKEPYPSHQNLKKGDWICVTTGQYLINSRGYIGGYKDSELYENFTESAKECTVKPPNERMHANVVLDTSRRPRPSPDEMRWAMELAQQYVELQCVVVALQYMENPDLNPDHDYDIVVCGVVVKCGDGNLYGVKFFSSWLKTEHDKNVIRMPGKGLFSEGDKVTLHVKSNIPISKGEQPDSYYGQFVMKGWKEVE